MVFLQSWVTLFFLALIQCAPYIYTGNPFVLPDRHQGIHLYLEENPVSNTYEFVSSRPPKIYPLTPMELQELYVRLSKQPEKSKYLQYLFDIKLSHWKLAGAFGRQHYSELAKPVFQLGQLGYGYPSNQIQDYRNSEVKPVTEHIEGDLKYDFRTNTHSI